MKILLITLFFNIAIPISAQTCPPPFAVCLTQEQANDTRDKLKERAVLINDKIPALEAQVKAEQQNVLDVKNTAAKNEADLRKENIDLLVKVGTLTGQQIANESEIVRLTAQNEFLIKMVRKKCLPFSVCLGGQ